MSDSEDQKNTPDQEPEQSEAIALVEPEIVAVQVKNSKTKGTRTLYKDLSTNKFVKSATAHAIVSAKETQKFLAEAAPKDPAKTRRQAMLDHMYDVFMDSEDGKNLLGQAKVLGLFDELSGSKAVREDILKEKPEVNKGVSVVFVQMPELANKIAEKEAMHVSPKLPSWAGDSAIIDAEFTTVIPLTSTSGRRKANDTELAKLHHRRVEDNPVKV